jgi:diphthine-ammonia ligase
VGKPKAAVSWSGGKDSYLALHKIRDQFEITTLLTMFSEDGVRSRSHGLRPEVLVAQASAMRLRLITGRARWETYETEFVNALRSLQASGSEYVVFGDIFLEDHRKWAERVCGAIGVKALEPLWNQPTATLAQEFLDFGGRARIIAVDRARLGESWLGMPLSLEALERFRVLGIDPCGEYGEYHTVVERAPAFAHPIELLEIGRYDYSGYAAADFSLISR